MTDALAADVIKALAQLQEQHDRMWTALMPFADYADPQQKVPDDFVISQGSGLAKRQITMGDCYAARAALRA